MSYARARADVIVEEELAVDRRLPLELWRDAIAVAPRLLRYRRAQWAPPRDSWEQLVHGIAVSARRLLGVFPSLEEPEALRSIGAAVAELECRLRRVA